MKAEMLAAFAVQALPGFANAQADGGRQSGQVFGVAGDHVLISKSRIDHARACFVPSGSASYLPLDRLGGYLLAEDNARCGGGNVRFTGVYTREAD